LEWLGESYSPGPTGGFKLGPEDKPPASRLAIILCLVCSLGLLGLEAYVVHSVAPALSFAGWLITLAVTVVYLMVGYFVRPEPDTSNLGWCGGLMDNPFRYSDDINRFLLFLQVVLLPGRFIAQSLSRSVELLQHARD
jgi:hypothetical protein